MSATSMKKSSAVNDAVLAASAPRAKTKTKADDAVNAQITENPFYQILFAEDKSLAEKQSDFAKAMTTTLDSKQDREKVKAYDAFREWLSHQQTALAENVIALSNVDSMAELQAVLKDMNMDLMEFEDRMGPIMNIIESIHYLRTNDLIGDTFRQIKEDQEREDRIRGEIGNLDAEKLSLDNFIKEQVEKKAEAATKRSFFGLGGLTAEAQADISRADDAIAETRLKIEANRGKIDELRASITPQNVDQDEAAIHKNRLRELLDMSKDENRQRVIDLRDSASKFITTAKDRTGSLRGQFDTLSTQIYGVEDTNQSMLKVYAIMNEGMKEARQSNAEMREGLVAPIDPESESLVEKMTREEKLRTLDGHVGLVSRAQGETMTAYGDLTQQAVRVHTMRESTDQQIETTRQINTQGVAATADRLATVLTAVSGAALGEASAAAQDTLGRMRASTNEISSREVIRVAMGTTKINDSMEEVFKELEELREVQQAGTGIVRNGVEDMQENMRRIMETAEQ
ncbi:MAG: hypothetical protein ABJN42_31690, partial [Roseibium sp.]|uniref:hypothetical protein n=1 Tax=Roseibium sp. TaxID=1936156 RepID=UPI0032972F35